MEATSSSVYVLTGSKLAISGNEQVLPFLSFTQSLPKTLYIEIFTFTLELRNMITGCGCFTNKSPLLFQTSLAGSFPASVWQPKIRLSTSKRTSSFPCLKCEKKDNDDPSEQPPERPYEKLSVERAPYHSYRDSLSGQVEPASGARASILGQDYLPEGTVGQARAAGVPAPTDTSSGSSSYGKNPGSRRKTYKASGATTDSVEMSTAVEQVVDDESLYERSEESPDEISDFVVYENDKEDLTEYELDKKLGRPHPFIDPKVTKPIKEPLTSEELWWNWRKPDKEQWSRWQKKRPDAETVFLKAMAETGQIKLFGEQPTLTETALYRARKHLYKEERLQAEHDRLEKDGPIAYYSEWVKEWKRDTSREAIQKHYEETGEDENTQLIEMFSCQTAREYCVMMGTDHRISRDPLAMRMKEDQIKQSTMGGEPVYPTVNYIQDPNQVIDFRGPDFHEPTPDVLAYLQQNGNITTKEEIDKTLAGEKVEKVKVKSQFSEDEAMAKAVDIGEKEDSDDEGKFEDDENITRNWSVLKSTPELRKSKVKPTKGKGKMTLEEAIADSENLTDFMLDFDKDK